MRLSTARLVDEAGSVAAHDTKLKHNLQRTGEILFRKWPHTDMIEHLTVIKRLGSNKGHSIDYIFTPYNSLTNNTSVVT